MLVKIKRIQNGEKHLLKEFIQENMDYINARCEEYKYIFEDYDELIQEAIYIFIRAVYTFKFDCDFRAYSNGWIYTRIKRFVLDNLNRVSDEEEKYNLCVQEYEKVRTKLNKEPSVEELWKGLFIKYSSAREIYNTVNFIYEDVNEEIYEEKYEEINDRVDSGLFKKNVIDKKLDGNQKDALLLKYGFVNGKMYSLRQIAKKIGYSHQGVDHLIKYGEKKLKKVIKEEY